MSSHREKALEAVRLLREGWRGRLLSAEEHGQLREELQAAEPHLQRMYWERFREAVLGPEAVWAAGARLPGSEDDSAEDWAKETIEAALDKAQGLMEENK